MTVKDELVDAITTDIYQAYGTDTGMLFGLPAGSRNVVRAIVKAALYSYNHRRFNSADDKLLAEKVVRLRTLINQLLEELGKAK